MSSAKVTIRKYGKPRSEVWDFRDEGCDPSFLVVLAEREEEEDAFDRQWRDDLLALFEARSAEDVAAVLERIEPLDAAEVLRALRADPEGSEALRALCSVAGVQPALPAPSPAQDEDEGEFWAALELYREAKADGVAVLAILSRPALRGRADLRGDFDRLAKLKGDL